LDPDQWRDVSRLFAAAVDLGRDARQAYLVDACGHDAALRGAVESLLGAHDQAGSFGEAPVLALQDRPKRLTAGSQLGPFRIETLLGAGGMGEVYRAQDTKLRRAVAIKVLPDSFANDPDRRARFEAEARALASLNHPHVGAIYGVEESGEVVALVLELVDGPTLAERLASGPLPLDEILWVARQLAEGLEAAHDRGIVHRDLKPANIKITPEGSVKILDFGLAKPEAAPLRPEASNSPSDLRHATRVGVIVGTVGYMSPEQARGQPVDKRTDIWAFGCLLFEMCARRPPFAGATLAETLTAVIEHEPDWTALPPETPLLLSQLLRRCLTKDSRVRLRDIGEARIALAGPAIGVIASGPARRPKRRGAVVPAALATLAVAAVLALGWYGQARSEATPGQAVRFVVFPPEGTQYNFHPGRGFFALSPDGSELALIASTHFAIYGRDAESRIYLRAMGDLETRPLPGTEGASSVFWSPDGRSLGFFADGKLKRLDLPHGAPITICDVQGAPFLHATWSRTGVILMAHGNSTAISSVPAAGGTPREVVTRNPSNHEVRVHWPWFLPDGRHFLYTARLEDGEGEIRLGELDGATHLLMRGSSNAEWIDPNVVVFVREGVLLGQRVDLTAMQPVGEPFGLADHVEYFFTTSRATFSASRTGTIAFHAGGELTRLAWADRNGKELATIGSPGEYEEQSTRLSRDGTTLLAARRQPGLGTLDIWRLDLVRGIEERLTQGRGSELTPVWIDGERSIVYAADSGGSIPHLFRRDLASGAETQLLPGGLHQLVMDVLPGGSTVAYAQRSPSGHFSVFQVSTHGDPSPSPLLPARVDTFEMRISPDGHTLAFVMFNDERLDLYVGRMPMTSAPVLAAAAVRSAPRWSADGRELYYLASDNRMMSVPVRGTAALALGTPQPLFELKPSDALLEVARDGRFLLLISQVRAGERPIVVNTAALTPSP